MENITEDYRAGNTELLGKCKEKKRKITEITDITDKQHPAFHWVFTWNNYPKNWKDYFEDRKCLIEKIFVEEEVGEKGTPHLQGWLRLTTKNTARTHLRLPKEVHYEVMSRYATEKNNTDYCSKAKTNHLCWGIKLPYKINIEKKPWMIELLNIIKGPEEFRSIHWIWEPDGNFGKTAFAKIVYTEVENVIIINGKGNDIRHGVADYLNKRGIHPKTVIMNVPRVNKEYVSYEAIENVKDMLFYSGKYEGAVVCGPCPHVIILANDRPETFKMSTDRWKIGRLTGEEIVWE